MEYEYNSLINKIHCCNCLDLMARMPDEFVDLTVTSPPYDNLRTYNGYEFDFESIAKELYRVTKQGGVVVWVVNDSTVNGSETLTSCKQKIFFRERCGFNIHDTMIYERTSAFPGTVRYYQDFEYTFVLSRDKPKSINLLRQPKTMETVYRENFKKYITSERQKNGTLIKKRKQVGKIDNEHDKTRIKSNVWKINRGFLISTLDKVAYEHPAIFPEKLAADHIYSWSNEGDLVYDPMCGSGTTLKMAVKYKRNFIGSELSQEYVNISNKRIEPLLKQETLF